MTSIKLKKSSVAGKVPVDSDLAHGELAINFQDGKLFYKDASNNIKAFIDSAAVDSLITTRQGLDSAGVKSVHFADNESLTFGNDSDLSLYHDGTHSYIQDKGTGDLRIVAGGQLQIRNNQNNNSTANFFSNGRVELNYNGSEKLETTSTGVIIFGQSGVSPSYSGDVEGLIIKSAIADSANDENVAFRVETSPSGGTADKGFDIVQVASGATASTDIEVRLGNRFTNATTPSEIVLKSNDASITADKLILAGTSGPLIKTTGNLSSTDISLLRASGSTDGTFGFDVKYMGSRSGNNNSYSLFMHNQTGTDVEAMTVLQDGKVGINQVTPTAPLHVGGAGLFDGDLTLVSTDSSNTDGPIIKLTRNSASPAVNDILGSVRLLGKNDADQDVTYAEIDGIIFDETDGTENGALRFTTINNGTQTVYLTLGDEIARFQQNARFDDNIRAKFGNSGDLEIYHDGNNSYIKDAAGAGAIIHISNVHSFRNAANTEQLAKFVENGKVELYHNDKLTFETTASGAKIMGNTGDAVLLLEADSGNTDEADNAYIEYSQDGGGVTGKAGLGVDGNNRYQIETTTGGGTTKFDMHGGAETRLYYASNIKLETLDSGVNITGNLRVNNVPFSSGIDSNAVTTLIDSAYVLTRGGASIEVLQEDSSLSHLQRLSFAPVITDGEVLLQPKISVLDSAGTESLLNINFAGGGGVDSAATIAIVNGVLTNVTFTGDVTFDSANAIMFDKSDQALEFGDKYKAVFGTDGDGSIRYNGNNLVIHTPATGISLQPHTEANVWNGSAYLFRASKTNNKVELYANNTKRLETLDSGVAVTGQLTADSATLTGGITATHFQGVAVSDKNKFRYWSTSNQYVSGFAAGYTYGGLGDGGGDGYAINWTNSNVGHRGFVWNRDGHTGAQGSMALTSNGKLTVAHSARIGYGENDTTTPGAIHRLDVSGSVKADSATISGLKLPTADGTVNQAILTDGNGNLTFGTVALSSAGGAAGVFNQVAVNSFTGDSSNKNFTLAAAPVGGKNSVVITINGIVQHVNTYSLSGSTITLDSAPQTGDAIEMRTHDDYVANVQLRDYTSYVYTPSTNTTAFSGADANGNTLAYDQGKVQVYLNGAKLVTGSDYIETSGTTLTLDSAIGSGDTLEIVSLSKAAIADFGVLPVDSDLTTTTANQIIHEFNRSDFRTVKYLVQLEHDSDNKYHSEEILLTHNNTTVAMTTYAQILLDSNLGSFDADISGANVRLKLTPTKTNTSVKLRAIRVGA